MQFTNFTNGTQYTLGAELELRILNQNDYTLANHFDFIKSNLNNEFKNNITSEYLKSLVEINTPIFEKPSDISKYIKTCIHHMKEIAKKKNLILTASGSYSLENQNIEISPNQRYEELYKEHQVLLQDFAICGYHIHVGFSNFDEALNAYNFSLKYLPLLLALSASSLFFNNEYTGIDSYRTKIFDRLPKASIPEYFSSYEEMKALYDLLENTGVIGSAKDIWWDIRIQTELKTIEFRVCDSVSDYDRLEVLIALASGICKLSKIKNTEYLPMQVLKQNMWSACKNSMAGSVIFDKKKISIKEALKDLLEELKLHKLIDLSSIEKVESYIAKDSIAQNMRKVYGDTKDIKEVEKLGVLK